VRSLYREITGADGQTHITHDGFQAVYHSAYKQRNEFVSHRHKIGCILSQSSTDVKSCAA